MALLSTEAEYIAQTHAAKEAVWIRNFVAEVQGTTHGPLTMLCDNQGAIALSKDNVMNSPPSLAKLSLFDYLCIMRFFCFIYSYLLLLSFILHFSLSYL